MFTHLRKLRSAPTAALLVTMAAVGCSTSSDADSGAAGSPVTQTVHPHYVFDVQDDRQLAGFADNVFFGEVKEKVGQVYRGGSDVPTTQFTVSISQVIKGTLADQVTVLQDGGYNTDTDEVLLVDGDPILEPGRTYLFATTNQPEGAQLVVAKYGDLPVTDPSQRALLLQRFELAVTTQIPFDG